MPTEETFNPYPGLRPFRTDEDYLFFGREGQSEELLRRLRLNRFLAVVGISGSGKSSLIRAGLLPYIFGGFMAGASSHWRVALFRPGNNPIGNMAHALSDCAVLGDAGSGERDTQKNEILLEVTLRRSGLGLVESVRLARLAENENLLIVVDQFEELFRYGYAGSSVRQQDDAAAFVKLLCEAAQQSVLPIYIVLTMRSDFIGDCARFRDLPEAVTAGLYLIPRMSRDQRRKAIEEPVRVGNGMIARRLVNRLLNDGGDDPDQLPSLQHALMRTWIYWRKNSREGEPIDLDDYLAVGGISDALSRHAEEAFADLPDERARAIAKRLFQSLTEKGPDNREVRRPTKLGAIAAMAGAEIPEVIAVIDLFRCEGRSFLTPPPDVELDEGSVIDISHESLIRGWERLKTWVEEEYESAKTYRRLAETAALYSEGKAGLWHDPDLANALRWRASEKPTAAWGKCYHPGFELAMAFLEDSRQARDTAAAERERNRRQKLRNARLFAATVLALFLVAAGAAVYAFGERKTANDNARRAEMERDNATKQKQIALNKQHEADEASAQAETNQDMALGFASSTVRGFSDLSDFTLSLNEVHDKFESLLKEAAKVHDRVLSRDQRNFAASVMRVNASSALFRLHRVTGRADMAEQDCRTEEAEAAKLVATNDDFQRVLGAYMLAAVAGTRASLGDKAQAISDAKRAIAVADAVNPAGVIKGTTSDQQALRCLSIAYSAAANVEVRYDDRKNAMKHDSIAIEVLAGAKDESAIATSRYLDDRSRSILLTDLKNLAGWQVKGNLTDAATGTYSKGIQLAQKWSDRSMDDQSLGDQLTWLYIGRGDVEVTLKQYSRAQKDFELAKRVADTRMNRASNDGQYDDAAALERLGSLKHYQADGEKDSGLKQRELLAAQQLHQKALQIFRQMEERRGKNPYMEYSIGNEELNLSWDDRALQKPADARQRDEDSLAAYLLAAEFDQRDEYLASVATQHRRLGNLDRETKNWKGAAVHFEQALSFDKKISQPDTDANNKLLNDVWSLGDSELKGDELARALAALNDGITLGEKWCQPESAPRDLINQLITLYLERGDVFIKKKALADAEKDYQSAERRLPRLDLASRDGKSLKALVAERFGVLLKTQADEGKEQTAAARRPYLLQSKSRHEEALNERMRMRAFGTNAELEADIALSHRNLGWVSYDLQDWEATQQQFAASATAYAEASRLYQTPQTLADLQNAYLLLSSVNVDWGNAHLDGGHYAEAKKAFAAARVAANRPDVPGLDAKSLGARTDEFIGRFSRNRALKDTAKREELMHWALEADENALKLRRELASANKSEEAERSIAWQEENVGLDYRYLRDPENARKHFRLALEAFKQLKPGSDVTREAAKVYENAAELELEVNDKKAAREALASQIDLLKTLIGDAKATPEDKDNLANALGVRSYENALLGDTWAALADAEQGLFLDEKKLFIQVNKADAYLLLGQVEPARKLYLSLADKPWGSGTIRDSILEDLEDIRNHPELKVDPTILASLQSELKKQPALSEKH